MLKFSEIFEFSKEKFRKIPILKEFEWFEWFEWFGPSPIEPFNSGRDHDALAVEGDPRVALLRALRPLRPLRVELARPVAGEDVAPMFFLSVILTVG